MHSIRLGIFFVAFTTLLLELTLIRVFDHLWFNNMAYMVITLAMFSIGVSGVLVSLWPAEKYRRFLIVLTILSFAVAITTFLILPILNELRFNYKTLGKDPISALITFIGILSAIASPFLLCGLIISSVFSRYAEQIQALYFWDLIGAALGCVSIILLVEAYGAPGLIILCAATALLAASFFIRQRILSLLIMLVAVGLAVEPLFRSAPHNIDPHMDKRGFAHYFHHNKVEHSVWDPVSSIDVVDFRSGIKWIAYDGGTQTSYYYKFDGDYKALRENFERIQDIYFWGPYVAASHFLKRDTDQEVLILGAAGGQETKAALMYGASHVDAVELVGSVVTLAKTKYADWTGNLYNHPKVNALRAEGRSFLRGTDKRYDIIQMLSNHTSSSLAKGSGAMSPHYLHTAEAYAEYFTHLKDDGVLHINHHLYPRMISTAAKAWRDLGRENFRQHVFVMEHKSLPDNLPTMIIKMSPWTTAEIALLKDLLNTKDQFHVVVNPLGEENNYLPQEFFSGALSEETTARIPYRVQALTDDEPFFNFIRKSLKKQEVDHDVFVNPSVRRLLNKRREAGLPLDVLHLFVTAGAALLFAVLVIGVPLLFSRTGRRPWPGKGAFLGYFACLGAGFIVIELILIQMFMKLVGFPTYTYAVVVFSLLFGAGIGSAASIKINFGKINQLMIPFLASLTTIVLLLVLKGPIFDIALQWSLSVRIFIAAMLLFPIGFFLGMPFPIGITLAKNKPPGTVAWCWAMNGLFTVIGGLLSGILSIYFGFTITILAASALYLVAMVLVRSMHRAGSVAETSAV